jgi:outer membrane protein
MQHIWLIIFVTGIGIASNSIAQSSPSDTSDRLSLPECIRYALNNQPIYKQSLLDEEINRRNIKSQLSTWLPQARMDFAFQHYILLPVSLFPNLNDLSGPRQPVRLGVPYTSNALFEIDQLIYSNQVLLASKASRYSKELANENITANQINLIVNVSKAFYDVLLTQQQLLVIHETIEREKILLRDAFSQYKNGVTDRIDYMRTSISLNISQASEKRSQESLKYKFTYLKQLMGYPSEKEIIPAYDPERMKQDIYIDTNLTVDYAGRIEYQVLNNRMHLQHLNLSYYKWGFLPSVSSYINYNFLYQSLNFHNLYATNYPNSAAGLKLSIPIFQGTQRFQNVQIARLQVKRLALDIDWFKSQVQTEYATAMGIYKSNKNDLQVQEVNLQVAREVYELLKLQYDQGVKPYLDVISAETDLRTSQINYLNALFNVLSSKLDVQRALGSINTNP